MPRDSLIPTGVAGLVAALVACSAGNLTLPGDGQPGGSRPAVLAVVSGDGQRAEAGTTLDQPLTVRVLDDQSRPVPDTPVRFAFLDTVSGASIDPAVALSDSGGRASSVVRLGATPGVQIILAEVATPDLADLQAQFQATALKPHGRDKGQD